MSDLDELFDDCSSSDELFVTKKTFYTRVPHIRCFTYHYPEVDPSKVVEVVGSFNIYGDFICTVSPFEGKEHPNPKSMGGRWYVTKEDQQYLYNSTIECAQNDQPTWRYFIRIKYYDHGKYGDQCKRYIEVLEKDFHRYDNCKFIAIESESNPLGFEKASVLAHTMRVNEPIGGILKRRILGEYDYIASKHKKKTEEEKDKSKLVAMFKDAEYDYKIKKLEHVIAEQALEIQRLKEKLNEA